MERRTRYDIYFDVLDAVRRRGSRGITRISYSSNLPIDRTKIVVTFLKERGLIEEETYGGVTGYRLTARGGEFMQALKTVKKFIETES